MQITSANIQTAYRGMFHGSGNVSFSGSFLDIIGGASSIASDEVGVSDKAKALLDRAKSLDIFKIIFPNGDVSKTAKSLDEVEDEFNQDFMNFSSWFGKLSGMLGLDDSTTLAMGLNGVGGVDVSGSDSATASKVRSAFNTDGTLVSRFAVMAARAALVDARNSVKGFDEAYSADPVSAIKDNIDSLKELLLGFRTVSGDSDMQYGFVRRFGADIEYSSLTVGYMIAGEEAESAAADAQGESAEEVGAA
ncbi:MAG: hypothetical protein LBT97_00675 [Planctomycetota bacterium]|nr:hypothetical protein [Planctomycetota bacterium]